MSRFARALITVSLAVGTPLAGGSVAVADIQVTHVESVHQDTSHAQTRYSPNDPVFWLH